MGRVEDLPEPGLNMAKGGQIHVLGWAFFAAYTVLVRDDPKSRKNVRGFIVFLELHLKLDWRLSSMWSI